MVKTHTVYAAVRISIDNSAEWVDMHSLSGGIDETQRKASALNAHIPQWAKANPVARFARFNLSEVE